MAALTREEHLRWAKGRALAYVDAGRPVDALTSMGMDLDRHPETANHRGIETGLMIMLGGGLRDPAEMRHFIEGFR